MRKNLTTVAVTTGTALAVAAAGLVIAPAADAAAAHRGTTKIHASKKHTVSVAKTLRPGVVHFKNTGSAAVVIVREKKKQDGAAKLVKLSNGTSAKSERELFKKFDIVELALPKSDSWVKLGKGTYFFFDGNVEKLKTKYVRTVTVKGKKSNAKVPRAKQITFGSTGRVTASTTITHKAPIRVANHNSKIAIALLLTITPSATAAQVKQVVAHPSEDGVDSLIGDGDDFDFNVLPAIVGPKHTVTATTRLGKGRYLVLGGNGKLAPGTVGLLTVK